MKIKTTRDLQMSINQILDDKRNPISILDEKWVSLDNSKKKWRELLAMFNRFTFDQKYSQECDIREFILKTIGEQ